MANAFRSLSVALFVTGAVSQRPPTVTVEHHTETYPVDPVSPGGFKRSLADKWGCTALPCKAGHAAQRITWSFAMTDDRKRCTLGELRVTVRSTITVPEWKAPNSTSAARLAWWDTIRTRVLTHEQEHVRIAEEGARAIASALDRMQARNCETLKAHADAVA